ncbi:RraA family protein [Bordetella petrii]|uniref:RraA family protein n=1 Tax=Bordetella petrii TaxID=94624 RepID=UPI00372DD581
MIATTSTTPAAWPPGYRWHARVPPPSPDTLAFFRNVPAACIADCLGRSVGSVGLRAYHGAGAPLCGPALTVRVRPGDNLMIHAAMLAARAGDVIVIDGGADLSQALVGDLMRTTAIALQLGGFVIDGAIRDTASWADGRMPVYARGHTPRGPSKDGPGEINVPIACAGMAVQPGDLVVGDADGIVVIGQADLGWLRDKVAAQLDRESAIRLQNSSGRPDAERFMRILRQKGLPV